MVRQYCSFLVRYWELANGEQRVRVEHVQTGKSLQVGSLEAALTWLTAYIARLADDSVGETAPTPSPHQGTPDSQ